MKQESESVRPSVEELDLVGRRLRALRTTHDLSQREVADAIGLPQSNLSRIENGKQRLSLTVLARMLSIYELSIQEFFARGAGAGEPETLSTTEGQLVASYRRLAERDRQDVDAYIDYKLYRARRERTRRNGPQPAYTDEH